jgi:hypothetical protein
MKFMSMIKSDERAGAPPQALMEAMGKHAAEGFKSGVLVQLGGLLQSAKGAQVRLAGGKITVMDGPFSEAKEVVGGFAIIEVPSKAEAIEQARRVLELHRLHWKGWDGECELRQLHEPGEAPIPAQR